MTNFKQNKIINLQLLVPSFYCAIILSMIHNPFTYKTTVTRFTREIGHGLLYNINVANVINNIFFHVLIIIILFISVYFIFYKIFNSDFNYKKECIKLINEISMISFPTIILLYMKRYNEGFSLNFEYLLPLMLISLILLISISQQKKIYFDMLCWSLLSAAPISFFCFILVNIAGKELSITLISFCYLLSVLILYVIMIYIQQKISFNRVRVAYIIIMCAPIISMICMETINIAVRNKIIASSPVLKQKFILLIYLLLFTVFIYQISRKKQEELLNKEKIQNIYYIIILLSLAIIWTHLPYQTILETEYFEQANHANAIYSLLKNFQIPLIENFDAHMLSNIIGNSIYGFLNDDSFGAIFIGYSLQPIYVLLFYFLFKKFFSSRVSFLIMLLFPISIDISYSYYAFGVLVILMAIYANSKRNCMSYFMYSFSFIIVCLFRLDIGVAFSISSFLVLLISNMYKRNFNAIKYLIGSLLILSGIFGTLYFIICFIKNINPLNRIKEFVKLASSNINWGYNSRGDTSLIAYTLCYIFIPIIITMIILYILYNIYKKKLIIEESKFIALMILGSAYIFNLSRGIVRHSLVENTITCLISTAVIFISLSIYLIKKQCMYSFLISEFSLLLISNLLLNAHLFNYSTLIGSTSSRILSDNGLIDNNSGERLILSDNMKSFYTPIKKIFDKLMDENETYLDFTNQTLLYPLLERNKPVYVNQSPGLLSGEFTQEQFIDEVKNSKYKVNYVLMPLSSMNLAFEIDGIPNSARYYLLTEYICNNYVPLFKNASFAIWCKKEIYNKKLIEIQQILNNSFDVIIDNKTIENITTNNSINKQKTVNGVIFNATATDPQLQELEKIPVIKEILTKNSSLEISIIYETNVSGVCQLFYTTNDKEEFSEQKSLQENVAGSGTVTFQISCNEFTKLRFDTPENSSFKIKSIRIRELYMDAIAIDLINYDYLDINKHTYYLKYLPYIWANYDEIDYTKKESQITLISEEINSDDNNMIEKPIEVSKIDKEQGNYLLLDISAVEATTIQVLFGNKTDLFTAKSSYFMDINRGQHILYLVRVSSDFMWYSNEINTIQILAQKKVIINRATIIQGDTLH